MSKYFISICLALFSLHAIAQEETTKEKDTLVYKKNYGLRVGVDISKPIIASRDSNFSGFEIVADYRLKKNLYIAGEIGTIEKTTDKDNYNFSTKGQFITAGININAFKNWLEMDNEIYYGARYGFSTFSQTLNSYSIFQNGSLIDGFSDSYFEPNLVKPNQEFSGLTAHWVSLVLGLKVETFKNLYLGVSVNISKLLITTELDNFETFYIPGFNKVYSTGSGISFNYTISYRIPLYKK